MDKSVTQHYWEREFNWQDQRRQERRLHLVPDPVKKLKRQPIRNRWTAWWDNHYIAIFDGFGISICIVVFLSSLFLAYIFAGRMLGWW